MKRDERIERYLREMPDVVREEVDRAKSAGFDPQPTGSMLFCPEAKRDGSDWDLHFLATEEWIGGQESWQSNNGSPTWGGVSLKKWFYPTNRHSGICVNLIAHVEPLAFESFACATAICAAIGGPTEKGGRIHIFERIKNEQWSLSDLRPFQDWDNWPQEQCDLIIAADAWEECGDMVKAEWLRDPTKVVEFIPEETEGIPF